jgi:hypothetical protein
VDTPNSNTLFAASSNSIPSNNATKEIGMDTAAMDISPDDVTPDPALMNIAPSCDKSNSDSNLNMVSQNLQKTCIFWGGISAASMFALKDFFSKSRWAKGRSRKKLQKC